MTRFELAYRCANPFLPPLYGTVRKRLRQIVDSFAPRTPELLDVGGRKSHYTIGIPANVTISELPRASETQIQLNLGVTDSIIATTQARRSNVRDIVYDDMTHSSLPDCSFDCVVAVEVLEHVEEDKAFVREVHRVLRPGGLFLMTTPNGDSVPIPHNVDHKRHYRRSQLESVLGIVFDVVDIDYAIVAGAFRTAGLRPWTLRRPVRTAVGMTSNVINALQSRRPHVRQQAIGTRHLVAVARKGS